MSGFDPTWLALREPYDHAVRDADLTAAFVAALGPSPRIVDLGCGTGSNLRYLSPHLPADQRWTCVDYDPALLERLVANKPPAIEVQTLHLDLAKGLGDVSMDLGAGVTSAALLDLTSAAWLDRLAALCHRNPVLMTLSVDGETSFGPADPLDDDVTAAFWHHQRTDKGFGTSLGPDAADYLAERLGDLGHEVRLAKSDWVFSGDDGAILDPLLRGIAAAASEVEPHLPTKAWLARRLADAETGRLEMTVGHLDLLALPRSP